MKFKKSIIVLIIALLSSTMPIKAIEVEADISFATNTNPTPPVNPEKPEIPSGETGTGAPGPLSIDYASVLSFGANISISGSTETYETTATKPYVQVSDLRGTGAGWELTASLSPFKDSKGAVSLPGAKIQKEYGSPLSANPNLTPPIVPSKIILTSDDAIVPVMTANPGTGTGTWVARFFSVEESENASTSLIVLAGTATPGSHTAKITWNLKAAP